MFCGLMEGILYKALTEWGRSRAKCNGGGADEDEDEDEEDEGEKPEESEDSKMDAENPVGELSLRTIVTLKLVVVC